MLENQLELANINTQARDEMLAEVPGSVFQEKPFSSHFQTSSKGTVHTLELRN